MASKSVQGKIWFIEIYEDDVNYPNYQKGIEEQYEWVRIRHDKDVVEETGELKKPHIHYLIKTENTASLSTISYRTGVPENYIKVRSSYKFSFRYLLHLDQPDKHQYSEEELEGIDIPKKISKYVNKDADECVIEIINLVHQYQFEHRPYGDLIVKIVEEGLWGYFRQAQATFRQLWDDALNYGYCNHEIKSDEEL